MALNSVVLEGRLVNDPDLRVTTQGTNVCSFSIAVQRRGKDAGADFFDCTAWSGTAETIAKYFKKGSPIAISGRLRQESWEKDGKKYHKVSVMVNEFSFLSGASKHEEEPTNDNEPTVEPVESNEIPLEDIPF